MSENKKIKNTKENQNPKEELQDGSATDFENNGSTKKSHQVMNQNSRKDIIDKNTNQSSRDSI